MRRLVSMLSLAIALAAVAPTPAQSSELDREVPAPPDQALAELSAMNTRLNSLAAPHPDGDGGTYLDNKTGELVVRYVNNRDGRAIRDRVLSGRRAGTIAGVRVEESPGTIHDLRSASARLDSDRRWAEQHSPEIHQISHDEGTMEIVVFARSQGEVLRALAERTTGFPVRVSTTEIGIVPLDSRRQDESPYNGGLALHDSPTTRACLSSGG